MAKKASKVEPHQSRKYVFNTKGLSRAIKACVESRIPFITEGVQTIYIPLQDADTFSDRLQSASIKHRCMNGGERSFTVSERVLVTV